MAPCSSHRCTLRSTPPVHRRGEVLHTVTYSPGAVALASGASPSVPSEWHRVSFGGLNVAVPRSWAVVRQADWPISCGPTDLSLSEKDVLLSAGRRCPHPPARYLPCGRPFPDRWSRHRPGTGRTTHFRFVLGRACGSTGFGRVHHGGRLKCSGLGPFMPPAGSRPTVVEIGLAGFRNDRSDHRRLPAGRVIASNGVSAPSGVGNRL